MIQEYKDELKKLVIQMKAAERFANKLPIFKHVILNEKLYETKDWIKFGERYKTMPFPWGINRGLYDQEINRNITNYDKPSYRGYLFCLYINTLYLYDRHEKYGIQDINAEYVFYDSCNTTFYATDDQIELLLEKLHEWYIYALTQVKITNAKEKVDKLQYELQKAMMEIKS